MKVRVGIIGGGQLGKMIAQEAQRMSIQVIILDPSKDCPASTLCSRQIIAGFKDPKAIRELAEASDVLTYEIESGNSETLRQLELDGFKIFPSSETLRVIQDKFLQKDFLKKKGLPVPHCIEMNAHLNPALNFGYPFLLKHRTDAYDGRGNLTIRSEQDFQQNQDVLKLSSHKYMVEEFVPFEKEISVMVARNSQGQVVSYPVVENIHQDHILVMTLAPARIPASIEKEAKTPNEFGIGISRNRCGWEC